MQWRALQDDDSLRAAAHISGVVFHAPPGPPAPEEQILAHLRRHMGYPGFRGVVLTTAGRDPVGFAYGYRSMPGQFYHTKLEAHLTPAQSREWLQDSFEFVELAVLPGHRRRGWGLRLHDALLADAVERTAILTTEVENVAARTLYERRGWTTLAADFDPRGSGELFLIMGKALR